MSNLEDLNQEKIFGKIIPNYKYAYQMGMMIKRDTIYNV
jgi:hypothetical protein